MPKGYYIDGDYMGWIPSKSGIGGKYRRFDTIDEYWEVFKYETSRIFNKPHNGKKPNMKGESLWTSF